MKRFAWMFVMSSVLLAAPAAARPLGAVEADRARISSHLARVEAELAARDVSTLAPELLAERRRNIARLRQYRLAGEFPHNTEHPGERAPYFIDRDGRACAVGALIIASGDEELAERVSATENNARLREMTTPGLTEWVEKSGLSLAECAQIQPSYCDESLCTDGIAPVCGKSGQSYECLKVLEQCSNDEYAYDGECVDGGPPDGGPPIVVGRDDDADDGCNVGNAGSRHGSLAALVLLLALGWARRRR